MSEKQRISVPIVPTLAPFPEDLRILQERLEGMGFMIAYAGGLSFEPGLIFVPLTKATDLNVLTKDIERIRAKFPDTLFAGIRAGRLQFSVTDAYRAGLSALYSMPLEEDMLINKVYELVPVTAPAEARELTFDQLTRVSLGDLQDAISIPFNLYLFLPMNQKVILYVEEDRAIDEKVLRKFRENPHYNLYIRRSDLSKYFEFCRSLLKIAPEGLAPAEASRQAAAKLAGLMAGFFNDDNISDEDRRNMLENLKSLVSQMPDHSGEKRGLVEAVGKLVAQQMTHVSHAQNVAAYCCLFGMALGQTEPESLRIGGLLHDLGLAEMPNELIGRELSEMTTEQAAKYKLHPGGGKLSVEVKKLGVPAFILEMVLYHHERGDGSGYPYGKKWGEIPIVAKICAFADEFDKLTSVRPGKRQLSPRQALRRIAGLDGKPPMLVYEESIHRPLLELLLDSKALQPAAEPLSPPPESVPRTTIDDLLKNPLYVVTAKPALSADPALADLRLELEEHWAAHG